MMVGKEGAHVTVSTAGMGSPQVAITIATIITITRAEAEVAMAAKGPRDRA